MNLSLKDIAVAIDDKEIVREINIDEEKNEFVGIIGPNGSGKSTILKTIYRVLKKCRGDIFFDSLPIEHFSMKKSAQFLGVLTQNSGFSFDFTVLDLVLMGRTPFKKAMELDHQDDYEIALEALKTVGMETFMNSSFHTLSGGEQQRAMMARVIAGTPKLLLLDEMTNHLDIYYQLKLLDLVKAMNIGVLAVMHNLNLAAKYCTKIYVLHHGQIYEKGSPIEVLTPQMIAKIFHVKAHIIREGKKINILYDETI